MEGERGWVKMAKRVRFYDTGTTTHDGYPIYQVALVGDRLAGVPFGTVRRRYGTTGWIAATDPRDGPMERAEGPNRGRAVAALLVKIHGLTWAEAFDAAGVR